MDTLRINQLSYIYSYIASAYDAGKKLFDEFVPLIEYYFAEKASFRHLISVSNLTVELNEFYGINIPKATLLKLLQTMQKENKVKVNGDSITVLQENLNLEYVSVRKQLEDDLDELYADFVDFLKLQGEEKTKEEARNQLYQLVLNYSYVFAEYYGAGKNVNNLDLEGAELIAEYFNIHLNTHERLKSTFSALLIGAQKTALLNLRPDQLKEFERSDLSIQNVILDSNFALRLIRLQDALNNDVANDTFKLLRDRGVKVSVLSITVTEMAQAISRYLQESDPIVPGTREILGKGKIRFSGFYSAEQNGMSRSELVTLTGFKALSKKLEEKGLEIIYRDEFKYNKDLSDGLKAYKNRISYSDANAIHDLKLLYYCEKSAKQNQGKIRILTNDARLTSWNANRNSLNNVCITEMQLSSLFWIRGINKTLIVDNMVAALSDIHSWGSEEVLKFQKTFAYHASKGEITAENVDILVERLISAPEGLLDDFDNENYELMNEVALAKIEQVHAEIAEGRRSAQKVQELEAKQDLNEKQQQEKFQGLRKNINENKEKIKVNEDEIGFLDKDIYALNKTFNKSKVWLAVSIVLLCIFVAGLVCLICFLKDYSLLGIVMSAVGMVAPVIIALISIIVSGKAKGFQEVFSQFLFIQIKRYLKKYNYEGEITNFKNLRQTIQDKKAKKNILIEENKVAGDTIEKCEYALGVFEEN